MERLYNSYRTIVEDILENEEFKKLKYIEHHGFTRYEHSFKVSYISYMIASKLHFNKEEVARAGLLHDFFISSDDRTSKEKFLSTFTHPKKAVEHSSKHFNLSKREKNIIASHMFPIYITLPKYKESILVSLVDKLVAVCEFASKFKVKFKYATNMYIFILFGIFK